MPLRIFTANGSACSQLIGPTPHELGRTFSGKLSGTATNMKNTSSTAIAVARATITVSPYTSRKYAPNAGEITCDREEELCYEMLKCSANLRGNLLD